MVTIKFKKLNEEAIEPSQANEGDAGFDICAIQDSYIKPYAITLVKTGLAIEIPPGYEVQLRAKSGNALKRGYTIAQGIGTIDTGYRGEIGVIIRNMLPFSTKIEKGDMIAQLVLKPVIETKWEEVKELSDSERGEKGFGSTQEK